MKKIVSIKWELMLAYLPTDSKSGKITEEIVVWSTLKCGSDAFHFNSVKTITKNK